MLSRLLVKPTSQELLKTLKLALPIILSQLGQLAFGIMDTAMVGRIGAIPLSASAFVINVTNIPMVFALGSSSAVSILVAQSFGEKNYKNCGRILNNSFVFIGTLTLAIILCLLSATDNLSFFKQPAEVLAESISYYKLVCWSTLPFILFFLLKNFSEGVSKPTVPLVFLVVGLFCNLVLNWIFIYGNLGAPELGLEGAGIATLISRWIVVILLYAYLLRAEAFKKFNISFSRQTIDRFAIKDLARLGIPSGLQFFFEVAAFAGSGIMMGWLGAKTLAAHQISIQIASVTFMMALGFAFAIGVRIGQLKGEQDFIGLRRTGVGAFVFIATLLGVLGVVILMIRHTLPSWFISDYEVESMAAQILVIVCIFQIADSTQAVGISALRGLQDVKIPTAIAFFAYWVVALPLGYYLAFVLDYKHLGIWAALGLSLFVSSTLLVSRFMYKSKKLIKDNDIKYG